MTEIKRDLHADQAVCSAATVGGWYLNVANEADCGAFYADDGSIVMDFGAAENAYDVVCGAAPAQADATFIAEARTGWPHAIERAINAEAEVERLKAHIKRAIYLLARDSYVPAEIVLDAALNGGACG